MRPQPQNSDQRSATHALQAYRPVMGEVFLREAGAAGAAPSPAAAAAGEAEAEEGELEEGEARGEGEAAAAPAAPADQSTPCVGPPWSFARSGALG